MSSGKFNQINSYCWQKSIFWSILLGVLLLTLSGYAWQQGQVAMLCLAPIDDEAEFMGVHSQASPVNENNIPVLPISKDATTLVEKSIQEIAKLVTVRILTSLGAGSGVIISRQGQIYTVLTNAHVVKDSQDDHYTVLTADERFSYREAAPTHSAQLLRSPQLGDLDLAMLQFTSDQTYRVTRIGDSEALAVGDLVYAAGFPNWHLVNSNAIENTRNWGLRAFHFTTGKVGTLSALSLAGGYQIGYTNDIQPGMSGGPVLDRNGQLIGINGRLKYPLKALGCLHLPMALYPPRSCSIKWKP